MRAFLPSFTLKEALSCHFKGLYYSLVLPSSAAQDVVRTVLVSKNNDYAVAWGATWVARISGLVVLILLSFYGVFTLESKVLPPALKMVLLILFAAIVLMLVFSFSKKSTYVFRIVFRQIIPARFINILEKIRDGIYYYRSKKVELVVVLLITTAIQFLVVINGVFIIKGITGHIYFSECMAFIPLIEIICISLPLTPNGIGIRDALSALMFHQIALPKEQLGSYIILGFFTVLLKLVGGIPIIFETVSRKKKCRLGTD